VFWYLSPDGVDPYEPVDVAERDNYYNVPLVIVNGVRMVSVTGGSAAAQDMAGFGEGKWQNNQQLWWTGGKPGNKLNLMIVVRAGKYRLAATLSKARDYGIVQFYLDGKKVGEPVDLYNAPDVTRTSQALGDHELTAGRHTVTVEIVGANEKAEKGYMFGIDTLTCKAVKP
jgi:hypothetical protein